MPVQQSASQRAALQAAAELSIDEGDAPFYQSRPIPRLDLGDDDEAVLAAAGPVRPRGFSASYRAPSSTSLNATINGDSAAPTLDASNWQEVRQTDSPVSCDAPPQPPQPGSLGNTRNGSVAERRGSSSSPSHANGLGASTSSNQRHHHLEKMALPRDAQGVPFEPSQPNYGQVLSFAEEEERDRQRAEQRVQRAKSPRTPRVSTTPRAADKPRSLSSTVASHQQQQQQQSHPQPRPLSASQLARLEKLAAPKKYPTPEEAEPARPAPKRSSSAAAGSSSPIFDRLYASRKQSSPPPSDAAGYEESYLRPTTPPPRHHAARAPVPTPQQDALVDRLSQPKSKPAAHRDANGLVEYNPYGPVKRYYGGTTYISAAPPPASSSPHAAAAAKGNARIPNASWDSVVRTAPPRPRSATPAGAAPAASSSSSYPAANGGGAPCACAECGHALPPQMVHIVSQPAPSPTASQSAHSTSGAQPQAPQLGIPARPAAATTSTAPLSVAPSSGPTVLPSLPAKPSSTKPPVVVRTRRYVPPAEEAEAPVESVVAAPKPVEATRRRTPSVSASQPHPPTSPPPEEIAAPVAASAATAVVAAARREPAAAHEGVAAAPVTASVRATTRTAVAAPSPAAVSAVSGSPQPSSPPPPPPPSHASAEAAVPHPQVSAAATLTVKPVPATVSEPAARPAVQATRSTPSPSPPSAAVAVAPTHEEQPAAAAVEVAPSHVAETPTPTHGVVQSVRRTSVPSVHAPAAVPAASTTTLTPAVAPAAPPAPPALPPHAEAAAAAPAGDAAGAAASAPPATANANGEGHEKAEEEETAAQDLWRVPPTKAKPTAHAQDATATANKAQPNASVYERLAPPPIPLDKLKTSKRLHKKKPTRPPKPEVLRDEDFACQLEEFSPEPHCPVTPKKTKSKTTHKKPAKVSKKPQKS